MVLGHLLSAEIGTAQLAQDSSRVVDVAGSPVRVLEIGLGQRDPSQPVIVLQSGAGAALEGWGDWPLLLSSMAPVVGYDRPGLGRSVYDGMAPTPTRMASHARAVLHTLDIDPPYILVGHSWGSELIGRFASEYPEDVIGLVYLDPTPDADPEVWYGTSDPTEIERRKAESSARSPRSDPDVPEGRRAESEVVSAWIANPPSDRALFPTGDTPVAVVLATAVGSPPPDPPSYMTLEWAQAYQAYKVAFFSRLVTARSPATLLVATEASHFVHLDAPQLAAEAVRRVITAADPNR